jgi:serine protease Do
MRQWAWLAIGLVCAAGVARAADFKTLRYLNAPPATTAPALPGEAKARPLEFARIVVEPRNGEAWAITYTSIVMRSEGDNTPLYKMMTWNSGRVQEQTAAFKRVFDEELQRAGFATSGASSLFDETSGSADLKVGVLIDDIQGRFCVDCPNLFNRSGIPATVVMGANWEIYSSLERKVVAKVTTHGGADYKTKLGASFLPAVYEGFRENVRQLLANPEVRSLVTAQVAATPAVSAASPAESLMLRSGAGHLTTPQASTAVATVFAADGSGSGFLVSADGYLITNHHVVGASKYVKLKWPDGSETLGEVLRSDRRRDVALVKTDVHGRTPLDLRLGAAQQGETVFAIGSPLGDRFQNTMTKGIVSAIRTESGQTFIQSDVMVNHGSSGGPLLDEKGRVIGLTVSGQAPNGDPIGLNFFIPIGDALKALSVTPAAG